MVLCADMLAELWKCECEYELIIDITLSYLGK